MTLTEARGIEFVRGLGVRRVVVARELGLAEIEKIPAGTDMPAGSVCAWGAVRGVFGAVFDEREFGGAECESRAVCAGVPAAL